MSVEPTKETEQIIKKTRKIRSLAFAQEQAKNQLAAVIVALSDYLDEEEYEKLNEILDTEIEVAEELREENPELVKEKEG